MRHQATALSGVSILAPDILDDERGSFTEVYRMDTFEPFGIWRPFVQLNESTSRYGVLRGLHFQLRQPQAKLVRVIGGRIRDAVVDLRQGSPTFGRYEMLELSCDDGRMLYVPRGFAHGFLALSDITTVQYLCDDFYGGPGDQKGIRWNDPSIRIPWGIPDPILSDKDAALPLLRELRTEQLPTPGT